MAICCAALFLLVAGCSSAGSERPQASATGGMGLGGSAGAMASGAVASAKDAGLSVKPGASTKRGITVAEVRAPADGWVVVRSLTLPGAVLGSTWVPKGLSRDVAVGLTAADGANVRISLHVDPGQPKVLDYDPAKPERSADKPVVVNRAALEEQLVLDALGAEVVPNAALIKVEDQAVKEGVKTTVDYLLLPGASWISVNAVEDGLPGAGFWPGEPRCWRAAGGADTGEAGRAAHSMSS